jgi:hypothetical protein
MDRRAAGSKGGRTTVERHDIQHMREIGKRGFETTVACHWQGDRAAYRDYLGLRRHEQQIESFVDRELDRRLQAEEKFVCMELPTLSEPDDLPF